LDICSEILKLRRIGTRKNFSLDIESSIIGQRQLNFRSKITCINYTVF